MSCNGCRVLRKGCSETCVLRLSLQWIGTSQAQGHATVFVAKFFGRAGLISFLSAAPESQKPALFQSLLFEAAGRTVNPVSGSLGLLWTGNWRVCQEAVETVLRGGALKPAPDLDDPSDRAVVFQLPHPGSPRHKRRSLTNDPARVAQLADLDLSLIPGFSGKNRDGPNSDHPWRLGSPSMNSEESLTTTCGDDLAAGEIKLLNLFN